MWGFISKISSVIRDAERTNGGGGSLPLTVNDDLERGTPRNGGDDDDDNDEGSVDQRGDQNDDDDDDREVDKLTVDLDQVPFFVPHIEELYAMRNGERISVYRLRNYMQCDLDLVGYASRAQGRPIAFDMSASNLDQPLVTDEMDTAIFFVNPADFHVSSWINAFKTRRQWSTFRLPLVLMAIHKNFAQRRPDPFEFAGTAVKPEHIDHLEKMLRDEHHSIINGDDDGTARAASAAAAAAAAAAVDAPPTIEVHKKFDDVMTSSTLLIPSDPEPAPPTMIRIETRSAIEQLILDNIRVFSRLLVDSGSEFVFLNELEAKFFFFWASSGHYLHSRIKVSKQQLDEALKEIEKARTGILTASSVLTRGAETSRLAID